MQDERSRTSRLAALFIVLGLSLAAGGIAFNMWMLRVQEVPRAAPGVIEPANAAAIIRLMSLALIAGFVVVAAFVAGSFVMVRAGRYVALRSVRPVRGARCRLEAPRDEFGDESLPALNWPM